MDIKLKFLPGRRVFLKKITAGIASIFVAPEIFKPFTGKKPELNEVKSHRINGLIHNEDDTNFFMSYGNAQHWEFPDGKAGEIIDNYIDVLSDSGVKVLMLCTNARRTNYKSDVWPVYWEEGKFGDPLFGKAQMNMYKVYQQGIDYPARVIQRCRQKGISPWISLRMNDVHINDNLNSPFHAAIHRRPELWRGAGAAGGAYFERGLNYGIKEVRDYYLSLVIETLNRFDVDGLELDFMREPYLFSKDKEEEGRQILNEWLTGIRSLVDKSSVKKGHQVLLGVRVPASPDAALALGLDAPYWSKKGLVDLVVATPRWATLDFDIPLRQWRELLGNKVTLAGGLEIRYCPCGEAEARQVNPDEAVGAAVSVLSKGGDSVYLFNYFQPQGSGWWSLSDYKRTLKSFSSLSQMTLMPRKHAVTNRDINKPGPESHLPLPATGSELKFKLPLGPKPPESWHAEVLIEKISEKGNKKIPIISVNNVLCKFLKSDIIKESHHSMTFNIPLVALNGKNNDIISVSDSSGKIIRVEVGLAPA